MAIPLSNDGHEIVTQERLLLEAVERIERIRVGRYAVQVNLSRLRPHNRQEGHIRIALRMLEPMVNAYRGQLFLLHNSDIIFLLKDPNLIDVENTLFKLRALFSKDPLTFADTADGRDNFRTVFDFATSDYSDFVEQTRAAVQVAREKIRGGPVSAPPPLDPKTLGSLLNVLPHLDLSGVIRRQSALVIRNNNRGEVLFQEFYMAMAELRKALESDIDFLANRWLFQHFSGALDLRMLSMVASLPLQRNPSVYSLNLNIATVLSPEFAAFSAGLGGKLSVEIQLLDALADGRGYFAALDLLRKAGHIITIDGLSDLSLRFIDLTRLDADLYKVFWTRDMRGTENSSQIAGDLEHLGLDRVLLARCDSEVAIQWGLGVGIRRFQGHYVDSMLAAYTMAHCPASAACTLAQCTARHGGMASTLRAECGAHDMLDSEPTVTTRVGSKS